MYQYRYHICNQSRNKNPRRGEDTNEGCMAERVLQKDQDLKMINLNAKHPPKSKSWWHTSKLIKWNYYIYKRADFYFLPSCHSIAQGKIQNSKRVWSIRSREFSAH